MDLVLDGIESEFVGFPVIDAAFDAAAGHPHREGIGVVIATVGAALGHGGAAEFTTEDDEGVFEHAALFEIFDERSTGLIDILAVLFEASDEAAVLVPGFVEEFDKADASFDESTGEEAIVGEGTFAGFGSVFLLNVLRFESDIGHLGSDILHAA